MTLSNRFVFVDPGEPFVLKFLQCASTGALITGTSHYIASVCRMLTRHRKAKAFRIPTGADSPVFGNLKRTEGKEKGI